MSNPGGSNWTTNVNRAKTKRWVEAKSYSYDGDDWGEIDEYGEYDEAPAAAKPTGLRKATAPASMAGPGLAPVPERERANSFEGDERRAFSGPTRTAYAQPQPTLSSPQQSGNWTQNPGQNRAPVPGSASPYENRGINVSNNGSAPVSGIRKPSFDQADQPSTTITAALPTVAPISTNAPPPKIGTPEQPSTPTLIRPADIYRRMAEEREKERLSQESSRPSISSLTRDQSPAGKSDHSGHRKPSALATSSYTALQQVNSNTVNSIAKPSGTTSLLPEISGISGFGDDFGSSFAGSADPIKPIVIENKAQRSGDLAKLTDQSSPSTTVDTPVQGSGLQHQSSLGYRTAVNQAFDQAVPPTPSSTAGSGIDRSNSDSTSQISPIISREASTAVRPPGMSNIDSIAEEPANSSRPGTSATPTKRQSADTATVTSSHRRDASLPDAQNTAAKQPAIESTQQLAKPQEAEIAITTPSSVSPAGRERSASPSKSRVRDLVDKIDSANNSRRGSQASLGDKFDLAAAQRPGTESKESFRPAIPGAWASYTTNPIPGSAQDTANVTPEGSSSSPAKQTIASDGEAFAKAAAAGSALAGAFAAAAGVGPSTNSNLDSEPLSDKDRPRTSKTDTAFHPEASRLPLPRLESDTPSSIMPTPMEMKPDAEQKPEYFQTIAPLQQRSAGPTTTTNLAVPQASPRADDMSTHSSPTDLESDRLRKEIVRELSPKRDEPPADTKLTDAPPAEETGGYSAIYDSYLNDDEALSRETSKAEQNPTADVPVVEESAASEKPQRESVPPIFSSTSGPLEDNYEMAMMGDVGHGGLARQFSWETPLEDLGRSARSTPKVGPVAKTELSDVPTAKEMEASSPSAADIEMPTHHVAPTEEVDLNKELPASKSSNVNSPIVNEPDGSPAQHFSSQGSAETVLPPASNQKVPAFREIMAISSVNQRIQVYDQTRQTFASMDTGLLQWIQATIDALPEHEDVLRSGGVFPGVVRPPPGSAAQTTAGLSSASRPSYGPTSGKSVKGKDLLHTAGVLGGKTSSKAKGLFAKGKSKWLGGADKASKRFRGRSLNSNSDSPSKLYEQENLWETDVSEPFKASESGVIHKPASKGSMSRMVEESQFSRDDRGPLDPLASVSVSPPTTAAPDSPTLGRSNTTGGGPISPLSGRASFERKRASLANKRASMEVPKSAHIRGHRNTSSMDSHRYGPRSASGSDGKLGPSDLQARLTVHQNQMRSFGEEFPADLFIPAEFRTPNTEQDTPKAGATSSNEVTPTQATFPEGVASPGLILRGSPQTDISRKGEGRNAALWLDTTGGSQDTKHDGPASPDYAVEPSKQADTLMTDIKPAGTRPDLGKHISAFSFIQFDPMSTEDLALKNPVTPRRHSFNRERSHTGMSSQPETQATDSSFADYPAAEDFGALPSASASSTSNHDYALPGTSHSNRDIPRVAVDERQQSQSSNSTRSRNSILAFATKRLSRHMTNTSTDQPTVSSLDDYGTRDSVETGQSNAYKRESILDNTRESAENTPYVQGERKKNNRKSLLGLGLSLGNRDGNQSKQIRDGKWSIMPSTRNRTATDVPTFQADASRPALTTDKNAQKVQRSATMPVDANLPDHEDDVQAQPGFSTSKGRKGRFGGLSTLINKAKAGAAGTSMRGRYHASSGSAAESIDQNSQGQQATTSGGAQEERYSASGSPHPVRVDELVQRDQQQPAARNVSSRPIEEADVGGEHARLAAPPSQIRKSHIRNAASIPDIVSNRDAIMNRIVSPPGDGPDYKTVYPPEFYGEQPPEGYYEPEDLPVGEGQVLQANQSASSQPPTNNIIPSAPQQGRRIVTEPVSAISVSQAEADDLPPPPPPKDTPRQSSFTTTTTTSRQNRGPVRTTTTTTTTTETDVSQQAHYEARLRDRLQNAATVNPRDSMNLESSREISTVKMPTVQTVTKNRKRRSSSPKLSPQDPRRSSIPPVAPLKIHKRTPTVTEDDINAAVAKGISGRQGAPHLTLDTKAGQRKQTIVRPDNSQITSSRDTTVLSSNATALKGPSHPFVVKRTPSVQQRTPDTPKTAERDSSLDSARVQKSVDVARTESQRRRHIADLVAPKAAATRDRKSTSVVAAQDPVISDEPLTNKKSLDLPSGKPIDVFHSHDKIENTKEGPIIPLPTAPPIRTSVYSPGLKDSPTLPRSTPSSTTVTTPAPILPPPITAVTENPESMMPAIMPKTLPTTQETATPEHQITVIPETPVSPLPQKPVQPIIARAMTPVEKMKDEPTLKEPEESEDEKIVMSSTAYPGQEWRPDYGYGGWDGYE